MISIAKTVDRSGHEFDGSLTMSHDVLIASLRATISHVCSESGAVRIAAHDGHVSLSGPVRATDRRKIVEAVALQPGVRQVSDYLEEYEADEKLPGKAHLPDEKKSTYRLNLLRASKIAGLALVLTTGVVIAGSLTSTRARATLKQLTPKNALR